MRLWSLHPRYLDGKGLVACWREGLLARKVLRGETKGYREHPQLDRFKRCTDPVVMVEAYLMGIYDEARTRGYHFDCEKIGSVRTEEKITVTDGQLEYEIRHLREKLLKRDRAYHDAIAHVKVPEAHPLFRAVSGDIEPWERRGPAVRQVGRRAKS